MTEWGVERGSRAAFPPPVAPIGDCSLMPPPTQGTERRTERRACRAGFRWGLRALVIGGLAGAAWLLSGTAAHAADKDPATTEPSFIGSVVTSDIAEPAVTTVLQAAAQPLESDRPAHRRRDTVSSLLATPTRVLTRPAGTLAATLSETAPVHSTGVTGPSVDRVVRGITGPLRLTGGPVDSPLVPVTAPLVRTVRPVTGLLWHAAAPAGTAPHPIAAPAAHGARTQHPVAVPAAPWVTPASSVIQTGPARSIVATADLAKVRHAAAPVRIATHPHSAFRTVAESEAVREAPYGGDGPAPLQVHLGADSGLSTCGSGGSTEGGSAAFLPAAVAASSMAFQRLAQATDVEVRRCDAEAPTVSPD